MIGSIERHFKSFMLVDTKKWFAFISKSSNISFRFFSWMSPALRFYLCTYLVCHLGHRAKWRQSMWIPLVQIRHRRFCACWWWTDCSVIHWPQARIRLQLVVNGMHSKVLNQWIPCPLESHWSNVTNAVCPYHGPLHRSISTEICLMSGNSIKTQKINSSKYIFQILNKIILPLN